ncbi:MAG: peptidoglycan-binding protein [Candidatus Zixiibacteriota bacterium]|nr:MAG: peptidoglycan-binding protein [candidate division Zixibacteria bacterium]
MEADTTVTASVIKIHLLGTEYYVCYQDKDELETAPEGLLAITNWKVPGDDKKLPGVQRRLQTLGYYNGQVDGKKGKGTEFAVLNFQADNKLRTDGEIGPKTRKKLKDVTEASNKSGDVYISRRKLIGFERAPHPRNVKAVYGIPVRTAPFVDDRGYIKVKSAGIDLHGPVVCVERKSKFRIRVVREFIDENATLIATSDDESLVEVKSPSPLPKGEKFILHLESKDPGRRRKATSVKIKYKKGDKETEVGSLQVIVMPRKFIKCRIYWVTIKDSTGASLTCAGTPAGSTDAAQVKKYTKLKSEFNMINHLARNILRNYGLYLKFLSSRTKTVTLSKAGRISKVGGGRKKEFNKIINANPACPKTELAILVVNELEGAMGQGFDAVDYHWPNGIVSTRGTGDTVEAAKTLAHEIGHFFSWANCLDPKKYIHADDDPDAKHKKTDLWTVSKLMFAYEFHKRPYNPGFGYRRVGGKVTIRNLPSDPTDNEVYTGNKWARNAEFYCKP